MVFGKADSLYLVTAEGNLYRGTPGKPDTVFIGHPGHAFTGLAFSPATGVLWGSLRDSLFTLDPEAGIAILQGTNTWNAPHSSITFNSLGTMYGLYGNWLVTIDKATSAARPVGETAISGLLGLAMRSDVITGLDDAEAVPGPTWQLDQNYPNPFNPTTHIRYEVAPPGSQGSEGSTVRLVVYDLLGREVAILVNERQTPGRYSVSFDGSRLASGMYIYRLTAGDFVRTRKMLLTK
jgi:hypothetical protein